MNAKRKFAEGTSVSVDRSEAEIKQLVNRYGADQFMSGTDLANNRALVMFRMNGRSIHFKFALPNLRDKDLWQTPTGRDRSEELQQRAWEAECRRIWRALVLILKAKLEAVDSGISVFEEEFLANIVLPGGGSGSQTVAELMIPQIALAYDSGAMPRGLPMFETGAGQERRES